MKTEFHIFQDNGDFLCKVHGLKELFRELLAAISMIFPEQNANEMKLKKYDFAIGEGYGIEYYGSRLPGYFAKVKHPNANQRFNIGEINFRVDQEGFERVELMGEPRK